MSVAAIVGIVIVVAALGAVLFLRSAEEVRVRISEIPDVVSQLKSTGKNSSFAVLLFDPSGDRARGDEEQANLQYSIEGGQIGLDWILLAPVNIADEESIAAYIAGNGFAADTREMNNVRYLRVEGGEIASLCLKIATEFYHLSPTSEADLIVGDFDWKSGADSS